MKTRTLTIIGIAIVSGGVSLGLLLQTDFYDYNKYHTVFGPHSPLAEIGTGNPVLTRDNCERYAYWLTEHQKEKLTLQEDFSVRYPPWGNQIFPLVEYCTKTGQLDKTVTNEMITWKFIPVRQGMHGLPSEPEPESPATQTAFTDGIVEIVNPEHEPLKYKTTIPVIDETYLSKNIQQWSDADRHELDSEYQKYGDDFYTELGRLLIKNEMQYQMNNLGIVNANDDFEVFSGGMLTSLPPHIGFSAVVYATDGNYYRLQGGTFANQVSYYRTTQLQFPDTAENLPMESLLDKPQLVTILPEDGNKARQEPSTLVIHTDDGTVEFFNNTPDVIRIQDSGSGRIGEEDTLAWIGPTVLPFQSATMTFDISGLIEWDARKAPNLENPLWWQTHAGGDIIVLSDDIDGFSRDDRARIAQKMLHNSDIPIVSSGAGNAEKVLKINLDPAIVAMVPDAEEYYLKRAHQLIPFDVEIVIDGR